jgi:hypothetical protein
VPVRGEGASDVVDVEIERAIAIDNNGDSGRQGHNNQHHGDGEQPWPAPTSAQIADRIALH